MPASSVLRIATPGQGLANITARVVEVLEDLRGMVSSQGEGLDQAALSGLVTLFVRHTSASLLIQENADPSARRDIEAWLSRLVPEGDSLYTHTLEGPDDMPAHIRAVLTATQISIPLLEGRLALGTWQGIYLFEHRRAEQLREVVVHLG